MIRFNTSKNNWRLFRKTRIFNKKKHDHVVQTDLPQWKLNVICCKFATLSKKGDKNITLLTEQSLIVHSKTKQGFCPWNSLVKIPLPLPLSLTPDPKSQFISKYLSSTFFRNLKMHHESKTKSWTVHGQTLNCLNLWTLMKMKKMKTSNFYKKKSQWSVSIISTCCFSFTVSFTFHYCCFDYFL